MSKYDFIHQLEDDEECKELKDYPGYFITTKGRVWSSIKGKGRWLSQYKQGKYYWGAQIGGKSGGNKLIHQLVGRNFLKEFELRFSIKWVNGIGMKLNQQNELIMNDERLIIRQGLSSSSYLEVLTEN